MQLTNTSFSSLLFVILFLVSCGGGVSGENGSDPFGNGGNTDSEILNYTLTLETFDEQCLTTVQSYIAGQNVCIQASLLLDGTPVSGEIITFNSALGSLSTASKLTNAQGIAQITLIGESTEVGAAVLSASFGELSVEQNYEYLSNSSALESIAIIQIGMLNNGEAVNRFQAETEVQLQTQVVDINQSPLSGVVVTFNAQRGTLNTDSALTDAHGIAQVTLSAANEDIGAAVATASAMVNDIDLASSLNYEVQAAGAISEQVIRLGHFDDNGAFIENQLGVSASALDTASNVEISAGGTLGLTIALVDENDQRILTQTPVTFTSNCVADGFANIDTVVNSINGVANATFEDLSCAGGNGNIDVIVASVVVNNATLSVSQTINIQAESIGSLSFVSAEPSTLVLRGTGGQNSFSVSTLIFQVNGALGNPLAQQEVSFGLNTQTGGLHLSSESGFTNSQGQVSTRVTAGNVPTSVRVTAKAQTESGSTIITQSDLLSVNTGLPDQNSITLSADNLNPEAFNINEQQVNLVARLSDTFNNPVPDGTTINFTAEGGSIDGSCNTIAGACSVTWTSAQPTVPDHRITILATAIGHETLFDGNGNNIYDDTDGIGFNDSTDNGLSTSLYGNTGFVDISEAWRDDDEDRVKDSGEIFLDYNANGVFDGPDTLFNGPHCTGNSCGTGEANTMHVRRALILVTSSSEAQIDITNKSNAILASNYQDTVSIASIERGEARSYTLVFADTARQPIPSGSNIVVSSSAGLLSGQINFEMQSTNVNSEASATFILTNNLVGTSTQAAVSVTITTPSGIESSVSMLVPLN
ncbi:Ig-like domain-containing protein [Paraglaciecola aquimarina]|uniref:Ig-like domain-containing protein n=1 Tax=Paraglaciecola algarum TaxID=3050085 RepID=A0ABS9D6Q3_9ALTE|nr:Ig-like domain-containing protein [Paraglaciecola sp. G1-23]MCF2947351.1 Ig-like domain-containing protein [Paraglaciecola sp. G1-23]